MPHIIDFDDLPALQAGAGAGDIGEELGGSEGAGAGCRECPLGGLVAHQIGQTPASREERTLAIGAHLRQGAKRVLSAIDVAPRAITGDCRSGIESGEEILEGTFSHALVGEDQPLPERQEGGIARDACAGGCLIFTIQGSGGNEGSPCAFATGFDGAVGSRLAVEALEGETAHARGVFHGEPFRGGGALLRRGG